MVLVWMLACGGADPGTLTISAWGEDPLIEGLETDDGWNIEFGSWGLAIASAGAYDPTNDDAVAVTTETVVVDLVGAANPVMIGTVTAPGERWDFSFTSEAPASGEGELAGRMADEGLNQLVIGEATKGDAVVRFDFGFRNPASYTRCENGADGTQGLAVPPGGTVDAVIYVHAEHLFLMALGVEEGQLGFDALAAAASEDGVVRLSDLAGIDPIDAGYEAAGLDLNSLEDYLSFSLAQAAHLNGEGLCQIRSL